MMKLGMVAGITALTALVAGCQSTADRGNYTITTTTVFKGTDPKLPAGWKGKFRDGVVSFTCNPPQCGESSAIMYMAWSNRANAEEFLRRTKTLTPQILDDNKDLLIPAARGPSAGNVISVRNLTNGKTAAIEIIQGEPAPSGWSRYSITQITYRGTEAKGVMGGGMTLQAARQNLQMALRGAE